MARPTIEPIADGTLHEFATFLSEHMQGHRDARTWADALRIQWSPAHPNYGFVLRDTGRVVGGIGAYYADRLISGRHEPFCNLTSWCVRDEFRQQSARLAMALIGQPGYHYTDFSPTKVVAGVLQFLKFKPLDDRQFLILNRPRLPYRGATLTQPADIESVLEGESLRIFHDHLRFAWLRHVVVGQSGDWCHVIYKRFRYKGLPAARILHVGDRDVFDRCHGRFLSHALSCGMATTHVDARLLRRRPLASIVRTGFIPKLFLSSTLAGADIDYLYSESMALDL